MATPLRGTSQTRKVATLKYIKISKLYLVVNSRRTLTSVTTRVN